MSKIYEGSAEEMESITTGITNLMTIVEGLFTSIVGNTYLLVILAARPTNPAAKITRR